VPVRHWATLCPTHMPTPFFRTAPRGVSPSQAVRASSATSRHKTLARPISAGPHTGHKPGRLTAPDGHSRALTARNQRPGLICEDADLAPPIFQAGALASALLTEATGNGLTMSTWSRMTTEAAKAPTRLPPNC